jgi:hypothetical protein
MRSFYFVFNKSAWSVFFVAITFGATAQNVGIGTATPLEKLHVIGNIRSSTLAGVGNRIILADPNGTLIVAGAGLSPAWLTTGNSGTVATTNYLGTTDSVDLVVKTRSTERIRVFGAGATSVNSATTQTGDVLGVYGTGYLGVINTTNSFAINGYVNTNAGAAIYGENAAGISVFANSGVLGVYATSNSTTGFGVQSVNANATGTGLVATGNNLGAIYLTAGSGAAFRGLRFGALSFASSVGATPGGAFYGVNNKVVPVTFGIGTGVTGIDSSGGAGVLGVSFTALSDGVFGYALGTSGTGVTGVANAGTAPYGVWGIVPSATSGGTSAAVVGDNQTTNANAIGLFGIEAAGANAATRWAVFANGDIGASGAKTFTIDHPLDPENKFLKHFSIESDQVINLYRGNAVLDGNGEAVVQLPYWFESVNNTNYSYNLTPVGQPAPLFIKQEIHNKQFVIGGGQPGMKVSWMVTAERNDPYMQQNPEVRAVEVPKTGSAQGKYLMPELYGKGTDARIYDKKQSAKTAGAVPTASPVLKPTR